MTAVKDNIATKGRTTCASGILKGHHSPYEATVIGRLREWNSVVIGKTNMDEFGMGSHSLNSFIGPVLSPYETHSAGGSSGGSAVAVRTNQAHMALGTDTGGSVRLPAAYTGITGFKPSYGLISRFGVIPYANSLDTVGILTEDASLLRPVLRCIAGHDPQDPTSLTSKAWARIREQKATFCPDYETKHASHMTTDVLSRLRIGIPLEYNIQDLEPGVQKAWENLLTFLQDQGCTVVPVSLPNTKHALSAYYVLAAAEAASNLSKYDGIRYGSRGESSDGAGDVLYSETRGAGFGDEVKRRILLGSYTLSSEAVDNYFIQAQKVRRLVQRDFDRVFSIPNLLRPGEQFDLSDMEESIQLDDKLGPSQVDFIVCPTAPTLPPTLDKLSKQTPLDSYINDVFTVPASLAGLPAISIPWAIPKRYRNRWSAIRGAHSPKHAGMQIIGQYSDDFRIIALAEKLQSLQNDITKGNQPIYQTTKADFFRPGIIEHPEIQAARMRLAGSQKRKQKLGNIPIPEYNLDEALSTWETIASKTNGDSANISNGDQPASLPNGPPTAKLKDEYELSPSWEALRSAAESRPYKHFWAKLKPRRPDFSSTNLSSTNPPKPFEVLRRKKMRAGRSVRMKANSAAWSTRRTWRSVWESVGQDMKNDEW